MSVTAKDMLLNPREAEVKALLAEAFPDLEIWPQAAVSQLLNVSGTRFRAVSALVVDFALVDAARQLVAVVEFDGKAHRMDRRQIHNDGVKDRAFRDAGYVVIRLASTKPLPSVEGMRALVAHCRVAPAPIDPVISANDDGSARIPPSVAAYWQRQNRRVVNEFKRMIAWLAGVVGASWFVLGWWLPHMQQTVLSIAAHPPIPKWTPPPSPVYIKPPTAINGCAASANLCKCYDAHGSYLRDVPVDECMAIAGKAGLSIYSKH